MTLLERWRLLFSRFSLTHPFPCALLSGIIATAALPPIEFWPALFPAFCGLYGLVEGQSFKVAFWRGWWFGLGHFVAGLYWIAFALGVEIERFYWLIPFTVLGLPAILGIFTGCAMGIFARLTMAPPAKWLAFTGLWTFFEYLRGTLFTGFPWNLIGYSWMQVPSILQVASVVGAYGLSLITILFVTLPMLYVRQYYKLMVTALLMFGGIWGLGYQRLQHAEVQLVDNVYLRLVQPCIPQVLKNDPAARQQNFETLLALSQLPSVEPLTHIIWPEAAVPFFVEHDQPRRQQIAAIAPPDGAVILGAPRFLRQLDQRPILWHGMVAINAFGEVEATYNKSHLVPFGEYIPMRWLFPNIVKKVTAGDWDYTPGEGLQTLHVSGLPSFSPLICYEGIFPGKVVRHQGPQPDWLLNLTNDAWYGRTSGPYQHLAITRLRAIEEGLPLVRVANNGISALVDPYGRIIKSLPLDEKGVIDVKLPKPLINLTLYARYGNNILFTLFGLICIVTFFLRNRHKGSPDGGFSWERTDLTAQHNLTAVK